jgi:hypothetical protein
VLGRSQQRWLLVATVLGSSMAFIDGAVVNLALHALLAAVVALVTIPGRKGTMARRGG